MADELGAVLEVKTTPGLVMFVDAHAVDIEEFANQPWPKEMGGGLIVAVLPISGRTLRESVLCMDASEIPELIEDLQAVLKGNACQTS